MKVLTRINVVLVLIANILVFWTWIKIFNAESDNMFGAMFFIPLLCFTFYYFILFGISVSRIYNEATKQVSYLKNALLLFLITVPMIVIYFLTT